MGQAVTYIRFRTGEQWVELLMLEHVQCYLITLLGKSEKIATVFAHVLLPSRALCLVVSEH